MQEPQTQEGMTLEAFRQMKSSGINPYESMEQADAALEQVEANETYAQEEADVQEVSESQETDISADLSDDNEEQIEIPESQKTAFQKALEREKRKANEAAEKKFREQFESEYTSKLNPYQKFFDQLGVTPEQALQSIEQNKIKQEAENLAYTNGWDEQQTQMYMQNQQQQKEMRELRVSVQINDLADSSDYPGIKQMKGPITDYISRNPGASVNEAYFAVGGQSLVQQIKREHEQREIAKRTSAPRKVVSDAPSNNKGPEPLNAEAIQFMRRTGLSEDQFRAKYMNDGPKTLEDFRKMNKKKG